MLLGRFVQQTILTSPIHNKFSVSSVLHIHLLPNCRLLFPYSHIIIPPLKQLLPKDNLLLNFNGDRDVLYIFRLFIENSNSTLNPLASLMILLLLLLLLLLLPHLLLPHLLPHHHLLHLLPLPH